LLAMTVWSTGAVVFSYLSRWYFEAPFLRLKDRWEKTVKSSDAMKLEAVREAPDPLKP